MHFGFPLLRAESQDLEIETRSDLNMTKEEGMAKGIFRTVDGLVMVEYGKRQGAISRALYKANGYRPVYEKLKQELTPSTNGIRKGQGDKKTG